MTKYLIISAFAVLTLASCKKDYSCSCTITETYDGTVDIYTYSKNISGATKAEATGACNEAIQTYSETGYTSKQECKLSK